MLQYRGLNSFKEADLLVLLEIKVQAVKIGDRIVIIPLQTETKLFKIKEQVLMVMDLKIRGLPIMIVVKDRSIKFLSIDLTVI